MIDEQWLQQWIEDVLERVVEAWEWICQKVQEIVNVISERVKSILSDFSISHDKNIAKGIKIDSRRQFGSQNAISRSVKQCISKYSTGIIHSARHYRRV